MMVSQIPATAVGAGGAKVEKLGVNLAQAGRSSWLATVRTIADPRKASCSSIQATIITANLIFGWWLVFADENRAAAMLESSRMKIPPLQADS